ncbi:hypothetical protein F5148DRAFT_1155098 [Russula earlei]|uniref:Uncharacterized protein n=1 Tax=Russula earlei TaxID=71964 RepID=A0ACC0TQF1_9AGAM|nr:hypothetical protein F5148DRAFT_1155098 [Russula earlei]
MHPWNENKGAAGPSDNRVACMGSPYRLAWVQRLVDLICTYTYAHTTIVNGSHHPSLKAIISSTVIQTPFCPIRDDRDYITLGITGPRSSPKHSLNFFGSLIGNGREFLSNQNINHFPASPFPINEDVHGPAIDLASRKTTNATSAVLALMRASNLSLRHEISDMLKDFLQCAWACELACGVHLALVKTVIDEMLLESDYVIAKLKVDLHPGFLSLVMFNQASQAECAIFEVLTITKDATTTHARHIVVHGESVHHSLHLLESIALDILSFLATELASVNQEKEKIKCRVLTIFGMQHGSLCTLKGQLTDLCCINNFWGEARDFLSLAIHMFNGVWSDLVALRQSACMFLPKNSMDILKGGQAREFLNLEAILSLEDEEEEYESEGSFFAVVATYPIGYFMDEPISDDDMDNAPPPRLPSVEVQDLEDETRRITGLDWQTQFAYMTTDDMTLPLRVPQEDDSRMWSVRVKICCRCLIPNEIHPPAITLAFALSSVPGHVFIEAFNITDVCHVVNGLVTVHDKQLIFIPPTECVRVLSSRPLLCSWIEKGQWPGGKRKRDGHPSPQAWTARELTQQYSENRVKVLGPGQFSFKGCLYQDGLAFELLPWSLLRILEHCNFDITPFDSVQIGNRILVILGEYAGIIGRIRDIQNNVADIVTQIPEQDSGLIISITLWELVPYFLAGDYVKIHWLDCFGMVITMDHKEHKRLINEHLAFSFTLLPTIFFQLKRGLYVEFPGAGGAMHRGLVTQISGGRAEIIDETNGQRVLIDQDDIAVLGVQTTALPKHEHNGVWEGRRVSIIRGPLKGYHGLVKADDGSSVDVELDAKLMSHGPLHQWVKLDDIQLERSTKVNHSRTCGTLRRAHPHLGACLKDLKKSRNRLCEECIPFHVRGVPTSSLHAKIEGLGAKTVPAARQKIEAQLNEVVVSVIQRGRPTQISINPTYLIPWPPSEGNKVLIIGHHWTGQVGKVIELKHGCCTVELEASGAVSYFYEQDVVNLLMK